MTIFSITMLSTALAMDAFAASLSIGASVKDNKSQRRLALLCAVFFGFFQFAMLAIGWFVAGAFADIISSFDHFIAFGLLLFIGGRMIYEAIKGENSKPIINIKMLVVLALATSIDAMAAGISLRAVGESLFVPALLTGIITFVLSGVGVLVASNLKSDKYPRFFDGLGGIVLIGLGIKILIEHLIG